MSDDWEAGLYGDREDLETYSAVLEAKASKALNAESERVFHHWRGEVRRDIEKLEDLYLRCKEIDALAGTLEIAPDEEREEEQRLAMERYMARGIENEYEGVLGKVVESHMDRQEESRNSDILQHGNSINSLRSTIHNYERLLYEINRRFDEIDVKTPYEPQQHDAEIIEQSPEAPTDTPIDLNEEFYSKTV